MTLEKAIAYLTALFIVGLVTYVVVDGEATRNPNSVAFIRILLSLAVAVLGATIPGFLDVSWSAGGLAIRAGGALALFVLTYFFTPQVLPTQDIALTIRVTPVDEAGRVIDDVQIKSSVGGVPISVDFQPSLSVILVWCISDQKV